MPNPNADHLPHVVILGGGFGGLYAAMSLRKSPVRITVVDRANHHVFQPLLYEVATAALSPGEIAAPIRGILARQKNTNVLLAEATAIEPHNHLVRLTDGILSYDYLVVATGARHSYFGHDNWAVFAPGLKTLDDALEIRRRFLLAFEAAEREADPEARRAKLTFVLVGAGPTGVELAGTMSELARKAIPRAYRFIDTTTARVILVEAEDRVLPAYSPDLSEKAKQSLEKIGVEVRLNSRVTEIDGGGAWIGDERIEAENVFWAAGVQASSLGASLGAPIDKHGRVFVNPDLSVPDHREVFVIGDLASIKDAKTGNEVPGIAPAAIQMGKYVGKTIDRETRGPSTPAQRPPFHYFEKGMLATIGRGKAVGYVFGVKVTGTLAWLLWVFVHIMYLIGFRNRLFVMLQWAWTYIAFKRGAWLITGQTHLDLRISREAETEVTAEQHELAER